MYKDVNVQQIEKIEAHPEEYNLAKRRGVDFYHRYKEDIASNGQKWDLQYFECPLAGAVFILMGTMNLQMKRD